MDSSFIAVQRVQLTSDGHICIRPLLSSSFVVVSESDVSVVSDMSAVFPPNTFLRIATIEVRKTVILITG